jgi:hypothetical protein
LFVAGLVFNNSSNKRFLASRYFQVLEGLVKHKTVLISIYVWLYFYFIFVAREISITTIFFSVGGCINVKIQPTKLWTFFFSEGELMIRVKDILNLSNLYKLCLKL